MGLGDEIGFRHSIGTFATQALLDFETGLSKQRRMPRARFPIIIRQLFFEILILLVALGLFYRFVGRQMYDRVSAEFVYRSQYGAEWKQHYAEEMHVTVEENHKKLLIGTGGLVVIGVLGYFMYRQLVPKRRLKKRHRRSRRSVPIPS